MSDIDDGQTFAFDTQHGLPVDRDRRLFRAALGRYPTGVAVVTAIGPDKGRPVGMTINSFASVSLEPPLILWSVDVQATTAQIFACAPFFSISVLSNAQEELAARFARPSGDRFSGLALEAGLEGVPFIKDALSVFECAHYADYPGGDHRIILGRVERVHTRLGQPLVFHDGGFCRLG